MAPAGEESRKYRNADTGWEIAVTRGGISESWTQSGTGERELLNALPEVLENAFLHRQEPDKQGRKHINGFHRLFAPVVLNNRVYLADVTLRESDDGRLEFYLLRARGELKNLIGRNGKVIRKKGAAPHAGARSTPSRQILTASKAGGEPRLKASAIMPAVNPVIAKRRRGRTMLPLTRLGRARGEVDRALTSWADGAMGNAASLDVARKAKADASGPGRSRYVHLSSAKAGRWRDPAAGRNGDLLDPIRLTRGTDSAGEAMDETVRFLGFGGAAAGKGKDRVVRGVAVDTRCAGSVLRHIPCRPPFLSHLHPMHIP